MPLDPGRLQPPDMDLRQWSRWCLAQIIGTADIEAGAITTALLDAGAVTAAKIDTGAVTAAKISVTDLAAISADLGNITAGNITLAEFIASGQTAYDTGTGFYLEYNSGTPRLSIGTAAGNKLTWDGTTLTVTGVAGTSTYTSTNVIDALEPAEADSNETETRRSLSDLGNTQTFTSPTWTGFSSAPSGNLSYAIATDSRFAELWIPTNQFGTSNATSMSITDLPSTIRPAGSGASFAFALGGVQDNSVTDQICQARIWQASHGSAGTMEFQIYVGGVFTSASWTNSGQKGFAAGTRFRWPL